MLRLHWMHGHSRLCQYSQNVAKRRFASGARHSSTVAQLLQHKPAPPTGSDTKQLTINGFVRSIRKQKKVSFATIGDGSSLAAVQAVLTPEQAVGLSTGTAVSITGNWQPSPSGKEQSHELQAQAVKILGENDSTTYPIQKKYHTPEFLRSLPHLRSRLPYNSLLLRLRSEVISSATTFFSSKGFIQTHPPIITSSDCEGAGEVFSVESRQDIPPALKKTGEPTDNNDQFFRSAKYLTVSSQLHLEALAQSVGKVWTLSPTFRAERSDTPRHLSEFYMLEAELCFVEDVNEVMDVVEALLRDISVKLQQSLLSGELISAWSNQPQNQDSGITQQNLEARWRGLTNARWPRIPYTDAVATLQDAMTRRLVHFDFVPELGSALQAEHEKYLADVVGNGTPCFVIDYPRDIKAFYMAPSNHREDTNRALDTVACFDLLVPELCEIVGGSMREHRLERLLDSMATHGLLGQAISRQDANTDAMDSYSVTQSLAAAVPPALQWYVDLRRYGSVPHGGFGLGFDRLLSYLSGVSNIRDVVGFPRWHGRCDC